MRHRISAEARGNPLALVELPMALSAEQRTTLAAVQNIAALAKNAISGENTTVREAHMAGGRTGAAARRSTGTSSTASATVTAIRPTMAGEPQPQRSPEGRDEDQAGGDGGQHGGTEVVDTGPGASGGGRQDARCDGQGDDADRQVHQEGPLPGQLIGEDTAQQGADDAGDAVDRAEHPLIAAAFARGDDVADEGEGQHDHAAAAHTLKYAGTDQFGQVLSEAAGRGGGQEDRGRGQIQRLAAEHVAELAPPRCDRGRREQVGGATAGRTPLEEWLERTYELVPAGRELAEIDWDATTSDLLAAS
jgi:hypothetical protein